MNILDFETQILFFLSIVGAFNSIILCVYFSFFVKHRNKANYFLSALLFAIGVKVITSVFRYFNRGLDETIVELGFSANALIGPLFFLYVKSSLQKGSSNKYWWFHIIPAALVFPLVGYIYPSTFNYANGPTVLSRYLVGLLMLQWFIYLIITALLLQNSFRKFFSEKRFTLNDEDSWLISLWVGIFIFWIGPMVTMRTTYMIGALSFSFIFYTLIFIWIFKLRRTVQFFKMPQKYGAKKIETTEAAKLSSQLKFIIEEKELFKNPNLKLTDVAKELQVHPHRLSQFLNDNLGKSFSTFINEYRIELAKKSLLLDNKYTLETIGYECGFNSKSTFFTTFKKLTGVTPSTYRAKLT